MQQIYQLNAIDTNLSEPFDFLTVLSIRFYFLLHTRSSKRLFQEVNVVDHYITVAVFSR